MFFLDYSSLKNRPVYLVDSSSLTSSPLGRELPAYLLFSAVTSSREDSFAVNAGQGYRRFSSGHPGDCHVRDPCRFRYLLLLFWTFVLKCNMYRKVPSILSIPLSELSQMEHTPREKQNIISPPSSTPVCVFPVTTRSPTSKGTAVVISNIID